MQSIFKVLEKYYGFIKKNTLVFKSYLVLVFGTTNLVVSKVKTTALSM